MNNKGFTLVELLGVIIILTILTLIVTYSVKGVMNSSKNQLTNVQIESIQNAAEVYYLKEGMNDLDYNREESKACVNLSYLLDNGYIDASEINNPKTEEEMNGSVLITYSSNQYKYKYQTTNCTEEDLGEYICKAVTEKTKTTGNVPTGEFNIGDEYICEVSLGIKYNFFVLSKSGNNVNLILDRNIASDGTLATSSITKDNAVNGVYTETPWVSEEDYNDDINYSTKGNNKGPITAMNYLYNATSNWKNLPNIKMNYTDEGNVGDYGYGSIKTIENITTITTKNGIKTAEYENLKARLPYNSEINDYDTTNKTNLWMYNYLNSATSSISEIFGYWISSSSGEDHTTAKHVFFQGYSLDSDVYTYDSYGIRPVITIPKSNIK